jgi:hypothetical protein
MLVSQGTTHDYAGPVMSKSSVLAGLVHGMGDWDIACFDQAMAIKAIPHSAPLMLVQYRTPLRFTRQFGSHSDCWPDHRHFVTKLHTALLSRGRAGPQAFWRSDHSVNASQTCFLLRRSVGP